MSVAAFTDTVEGEGFVVQGESWDGGTGGRGDGGTGGRGDWGTGGLGDWETGRLGDIAHPTRYQLLVLSEAEVSTINYQLLTN